MYEWTFSLYDTAGLHWKHIYTDYKLARRRFSYYRTSVMTATISELKKIAKNPGVNRSRVILTKPFIKRIWLED